MRNRFALALASIEVTEPSLSQVAEYLMLAALEAEAEDADVLTDPALLLLGEQIKFFQPRRTNRDVWIQDCEMNNDVVYPATRERH